MRKALIRLVLPMALLGLAPCAIAAPMLTFSCLNPKMGLKFKQITGKQAASQPVQFQINWDTALPPGTINVNGTNNGVCTVGISDGYILKSGKGSFTATGSFNKTHSTRPKDVDKIVKVEFEPQVRTGEFTVKALKDSPTGSVTIVFIVDYETDK